MQFKTKASAWSFALFILVVLVALFVLPIVLRISILDPNNTIEFSLADLRGVGVDATLVCATILLLTLALPIWGGRIIVVVILGFHLLVQVANAEFAWVFGRAIELSQIGYMTDQTFFWGSAVKLHNPIMFFVSIGLVAFIGFWSRRVVRSQLLRLFASCTLVSLLLVVLIPINDDLASWRTNGFLSQNARSAVALLNAQFEQNSAQIDLSEEIAQLQQELGGNLNGELWLERPKSAPNILMVVLESASAAYLPSIVQTQGLRSNIEMKNLDRFARTGVVFSQFYSHQRQTTRGTYALLCGQLPRFSSATPKLEVAAERGEMLDCLPRRLAAVGYHTEYLQAAPLSFSKKDKSLPLTGFQTLNGATSFSDEDIGSAWGVDDLILFDRATERIQTLRSQNQPWFLTVLNVGTHHPFDIVPASFAGNQDPKIRAFEYLDSAFGKFIDRLENKALLENTIVIVVSDESGGLVGPSPSSVSELARNWGLLAIVAPKWFEPKLIDKVVGQFDLPISVSDLLGIDVAPTFGGRSVFRDYAKRRRIYAFNNIGDFTYGIGDVTIDICQLGEGRCQSYQKVERKIGALQAFQTSAELSQKARALKKITNQGVDDLNIQLLPIGSEIKTSLANPYLICCQYLNVPANARLSANVQVELTSDKPRSVYIDIISQKNGQFKTHFTKSYDVLVGESTNIEFDQFFAEQTRDVEVRFRVEGDEGSSTFIVHSSALSVTN